MYYKDIEATYNGEWVKNKREGSGKLVGTDTLLSGTWSNDKFTGEGSNKTP